MCHCMCIYVCAFLHFGGNQSRFNTLCQQLYRSYNFMAILGETSETVLKLKINITELSVNKEQLPSTIFLWGTMSAYVHVRITRDSFFISFKVKLPHSLWHMCLFSFFMITLTRQFTLAINKKSKWLAEVRGEMIKLLSYSICPSLPSIPVNAL